MCVVFSCFSCTGILLSVVTSVQTEAGVIDRVPDIKVAVAGEL